ICRQLASEGPFLRIGESPGHLPSVTEPEIPEGQIDRPLLRKRRPDQPSDHAPVRIRSELDLDVVIDRLELWPADPASSQCLRNVARRRKRLDGGSRSGARRRSNWPRSLLRRSGRQLSGWHHWL